MFQGEPCHIQCKGANTKEKLPISSAVYGVHRTSGQLPPRQRFCAIDIERYPLPKVAEDGILVRVEAASICGSDGHGIKGTPAAPSTIGHEFVGRIMAMGKRASESIFAYSGPLEIGDRIVPYPWITCTTCPNCLENGNGICMICENGFCYGGSETLGKSPITADVADPPHFKGGFAEYAYIFPHTYVWKVPEDMPSPVATLLDPLAVAVRAIEMAQTEAGVLGEALGTKSTALIIGAGAVGTMAAMVLKIMGFSQVILADQKAEKLRLAQSISGADILLDSSRYSLEERIRLVRHEYTRSGPELVIQCANSSSASIEGLQMVKKLGTYIEVGVPFGFGQQDTVNLPQLVFSKNAKILGLVANGPKTFDKAFDLLKRHREYPFSSIITHPFYSLEDLIPTMKKMADADYMKGTLIWNHQ